MGAREPRARGAHACGVPGIPARGVPEFLREASRLQAAAIDWRAATGPELGAELAELAALLAGRPVAQASLARTVADMARRADVPAAPGPLREAAHLLAASGDHGDGLLAVALAERGRV